MIARAAICIFVFCLAWSSAEATSLPAMPHWPTRGCGTETDLHTVSETRESSCIAWTAYCEQLRPGPEKLHIQPAASCLGKPQHVFPSPDSVLKAEWVKARAIPLTSDDPESNLADLEGLRPLLSSARIIGLGEGTHGTREFFRMKHRLVRWMAQEDSLLIFGIEANMPEARTINQYINGGDIDAAAALARLYFWTWNTEEVLELIRWMRAHNEAGRGRVEFWGFDMQIPHVAADSVRSFLNLAEPDLLPLADSAYDLVREAWKPSQVPPELAAPRDAALDVLSQMLTKREEWVKRFDSTSVDWAIQNARIIVQAAGAHIPGLASRDSSMASNVRWIKRQRPNARIILWAHNSHIQRSDDSMGWYLSRAFADQYRPVGFALGKGEYTAIGPRGLSQYPAQAPVPGSIEGVMKATGIRSLALDLRAARTDEGGKWLLEPRPFRWIGAGAKNEQFVELPVGEYFDVLVYLDSTTGTRVFGRAAMPGP